jgi:tight adherence protein C
VDDMGDTMQSLSSNPAFLWLVGSLGAAAVATFLIVMSLVPKPRQVARLMGYRATARREGLEQNQFLKMAWPLVELGAQYSSGIAMPEWRQSMAKLLRDSGAPLGLDVDELVGVIFTSTVSLLALAFVVAQLKGFGFGVYILAGFIGIFLPFMWLSEQGKERFKSINRGLPQALDLVVMAMGAGLDFTGSLRNVVERWTDRKDPMFLELSRFLHELSLGKTRREALEDLAVRAPTELVRTFVANVVQAEQRGTPLVEILAIQADVARTRRFQTAEKIAGRAGVMVLLPLMLIFMATILVLFGGLIVKGIRGELTS